MAKDLLLEIGLEEVPARFVRGAMEQLQQKFEKWLNDHRISFTAINSYATPRRLALIVTDVADKQSDIEEEAKGPARKIAKDEAGNWSKAALGFARSQGVEPEALYFQELAGVEYVYAKKSSIGVETSSLLSQGFVDVITSMSFPKNMRWGSHEMRFVRPIRWMIALFGNDVVNFELAGVATGRISRGHRFLGEETTIDNASDYVAKLRQQSVIVDVEERQQLIVKQIDTLASEKNWKIAIKEDLLEEVLFLVEYPSTLFGTYEESFLHIPQEVLITSMREHQRYFPVLDQAGKLLPFFVTVRNGDAHSIDVVAKGNEKVLRARLSDAKFFYEEDHKLTIEAALSKLENIVYHEELGSVGDKVRRTVTTANLIAEQLQVEKSTQTKVDRAAAICKFDLVSQMVYEFPELQGIMGEDYATRLGEDTEVAKAINEHYQPRFSGDAVPSHMVGAIVSLADKIDTIVGCFSIGIVPTGSQDPYALRRQATGIVQILLAHDLQLSLKQLFELSLSVHEKRGMKRAIEEISKDLQDFFGLRVKNWLSEQGAKYDVIDAVMVAGFSDLLLTKERAKVLMTQLEDTSKANFKTNVEAFNRVCNLASKAETKQVDESLFQESSEQALYTTWNNVHPQFVASISTRNVEAAYDLLASLREAIVAYFDSVMVMAEDEAVKRNRLATLALIADDIHQIADLSKLVWA
ncbi:MAG: glycine--tRNA ligase subunit beta [Candidatus Pristimantibacillus lignocellulolyticus]|uniref:Glycine--tRNA ligase beta subunit n=1 Tax=Candidatus Pristimantibacillus lignocellulolyticus TaxID=2994561 RepID=A0A9J6ZDR8_9BACL|nr:MAG: glycine--tRNA ligase subunit beta [Candidatus Pristimantibacillus lignocellulolyticus]